MEDTSDLRRLARRRAKAKAGVIVHAVVYTCVVGGGMLAQHLVAPGFERIAALPALGWGLGLAIHAGTVFLAGGLRERLEAEELARLEARERRAGRSSNLAP